MVPSTDVSPAAEVAAAERLWDVKLCKADRKLLAVAGVLVSADEEVPVVTTVSDEGAEGDAEEVALCVLLEEPDDEERG